MIEFGKTLREAREAKGYSVSQLAEITHILPQIIENLEKEDFTRIVAPIYGRGFVKLYCETVGLEPQPLVTEFMEIFSGNRPPVIRMKESETAVQPPPMPPLTPAPTAEDVAEPPPVVEAPVSQTHSDLEDTIPPAAEVPPAPFDDRLPLFSQPPAMDAPPPPKAHQPAEEAPAFNFDPLPEPPIVRDPLSRSESEPFASQPDDIPFPEHQANEKRRYQLPGYAMPDVPRSVWRFGILIAAAAVVLALIFFSCRALYRATMQAPGEETAIEETPSASETPAPARTAKAPKAETSKAGAPANKKAEAPKTKTETAKTKDGASTAKRPPRKPMAVPPLYID